MTPAGLVSGGFAWRPVRPTQAGRRAAILDPCLAAFDTVERRLQPDGYPSLRGTVRGRSLGVSLIPDSLAPKRLPQLWLSLVMRRRGELVPIVLTSRPRGEDYVSMRSRVAGILDVPPWLPDDFSIRGEPGAAPLLKIARPCLTTSFADPATKEIAVTGRSLHMLYRLSEGRRGRHLIFRETLFLDVLTQDLLLRLVSALEQLDDLVTGHTERTPAAAATGP